MSLGLQSPAGIDRYRATDVVVACLHQLVGLESAGESQVFVADQFDPGEAVVHLGDVDVARCHAGHGHRRLGRSNRRRERCQVLLVLVHDTIHPEPDAAHPHWPVGVAIHDILRREDHRRSAVALRRAVIQAERLDDDRRVERLLDGDLVPELRFRVLQRVEVVLHRHHCHVFFGGGRLMQVTFVCS